MVENALEARKVMGFKETLSAGYIRWEHGLAILLDMCQQTIALFDAMHVLQVQRVWD